MLPLELSNTECPECGRLFRWSVGRSVKPKPGEASVCGWCGALMIFTDNLTLRQLDWPDWCQLSHTQKRSLVFTRKVVQARVRAARQ